MQNLPRLMLVVSLLLIGIGWSVESYLKGMGQPPDEVSGRDSKVVLLQVSNRDMAEAERLAARRRAVVLSVDPTLDQAVSSRSRIESARR